MQQSNKHSPVVDDAMRDPRVEAPFGYKHASRAEDDGTVAADLLQQRSDLARFLGPSAFPGDRAGLVAVAEDNDAPQWVARALGGLPDGTFETVEDVWEALSRA